MADETGLDIREIFRRLPHRYPILLVDRVIEVRPGERISAVKNVTVNEDVFRGHFPGNPIFPGVLIIEALAQAGGLLISSSLAEPESHLPYLVGIDGAKFRRPVLPGDRLLLEAAVKQRRPGYWRLGAMASVDGERAAQAEILLAIRRRDEEAR